MMDAVLYPITAGEILNEEFLEPRNLTAYKLAKDINVPVSRIQEILSNKRKITPDTSLRLAKYFSVSDEYFFNIQNIVDIFEAKQRLSKTIDKIHPCQTGNT